jgi:Fe/S biogenesis protein NfuA
VSVPPSPAGGPSRLLTITEEALELVNEARSGEESAAALALFVEVSGASASSYSYDIWFEAATDAGPRDHVEEHGDLLVVFPAGSADKLAGSTLDVSDDGLVLLNPNTPPAAPGTLDSASFGSLDSALAQRVLEVLEHQVNPQIASHGGRADLIGVDEEAVAYLQLSGGCQGCGLAQVTLSQGISVAIQDAVPEISRIVDVTSHAQGANPYYQSAKK